MKKKIVVSVVATLAALAVLAALAFVWVGQGVGVDVDGQPIAAKSARPKVVEVFSYGCEHCYSLEPSLQRWLDENREGVEFERIPFILGQDWMPWTGSTWVWAKTFYALEAMREDHVHEAILDAVNSKAADLSDEQGMFAFISQQGIDAERFKQLYASEGVLGKVRQAKAYQSRFKIRMTPTFVVNDSLRASIILADYNSAKLMQNVDTFVAQSRAD